MKKFSANGLKVSGVADLVELLRPILIRLNSNKLIQFEEKKSQNYKTVTVIQYWSQKERPSEISKAFKLWEDLLANSLILKLVRFDRDTAIDWLGQFAPEFLDVFRRSVHPAMEADIFRVAYAAKEGCIWLDADHVPPKFSDTRHFNLKSFETWSQSEQSNYLMKHWRENTPYLNNSIFLANRGCPLIEALSKRILGSDPANYATSSGISSFAGPDAFTEEANNIFAKVKLCVEINGHGQVVISRHDGSGLFCISNLFRFLGARKDYVEIFGGDSSWAYKSDSSMDWRSV